MHWTLETGNLLAKHPEPFRHEGLGTSQAMTVFSFWVDGNYWLGFFPDGIAPQETILNQLLFSIIKRREDLDKARKSVKGYFAEGKISLHQQFGCWEQRNGSSSQQWILPWNITPSSFIIIVIQENNRPWGVCVCLGLRVLAVEPGGDHQSAVWSEM